MDAPCLFGSNRSIGISTIAAVPSDACYWQLSAVSTPTTAEVVAALSAQLSHETVGPVETTFAGLPANRFEFTWSAGVVIEACDGDLRLTSSAGGQGLNGPEADVDVRFWVVEVDGRVLGIREAHLIDETEDQITETDMILNSVRFEP